LRDNIPGKSSVIIRYFDEVGKASAQLIKDFAATVSPKSTVVLQKEGRPRDIEADQKYYPNIISVLISRN
jgi:uncharacterized protein YggU (UPF0235/DUF167 family)